MRPTHVSRTKVIVAACALLLGALASGCSEGEDAGGGADLEAVRARLKDRLFEFGTSSGNRDGNAFVTGVNQLQLCGIGVFALKEKTSFSSSVGSMQSEAMHYGTWKLLNAGGAALVELTIERSSENNPPASKQFRVEIGGDGLRFDGNATMGEADMTADCEVAAQERR